LPIAPSNYFDHQAKRADPDLLSDRAKRDALLLPQIKRAHKAQFSFYGVQKL
jgi:putative transposase